jgi:hypothetical protein
LPVVLDDVQSAHVLNQFAYGLGTARYKSQPTAEPDQEIVKLTVMAVKNGYYHLDGAEGTMISFPVNEGA